MNHGADRHHNKNPHEKSSFDLCIQIHRLAKKQKLAIENTQNRRNM